jgi:hypothetical protein
VAYVEKIKRMNEHIEDNLKISDKLRTTVVRVSFDYNNFCKIIDVNSTIKQALQYKKSDVIGQPVNMLLPSEVRESTNEIARNIYEMISYGTFDTKTYLRSSEGWLTPIILNIRVYPSTEEGLQLIGFFTQNKEASKVYRNNNINVYNVK